MRRIFIYLIICAIIINISYAQEDNQEESKFNPADPKTWNEQGNWNEITRQQLSGANINVVLDATPNQAETYFENKIPPAIELNKNEWILIRKIYPNLDESLSSIEGVKVGDKQIETPQGKVVFGENNINIKYTKEGLALGENIVLTKGEVNFDKKGNPVFSEESQFKFKSKLTDAWVYVTGITAKTQLWDCQGSKISCIDEKNRERNKNTGEITSKDVKFEKRYTRELDINVPEQNKVYIVIPEDSFDDVNVNKVQGSTVTVGIKTEEEFDIPIVYFPENGKPGTIMLDDGKGINFHYKFKDDDGKEHYSHTVDGEIITCSTCSKLAYMKTFADNAIPFEVEHPPYNLKGHSVVIGGKFRPVFDKEWYIKKAKQAAEYGVDPFFWIAFSLEEYGGYRIEGSEQKIDIERATTSSGFVNTFGGVGKRFVNEHGASGTNLGDSKANGMLFKESIQEKLKNMGAEPDPRDFGGQEKYVSFNIYTEDKDLLDAQSFMLLKEYQDLILSNQYKKYYWDEGQLKYDTVESQDIESALQSIQGMGRIPYLYEYRNAKGKNYVKVDEEGELIKYKGESSWDSGITGAEYPIYGYTLSNFIKELYNDPRIREIIPKDAPLPITSIVLEDSEKK